jgi:hypothetical protein
MYTYYYIFVICIFIIFIFLYINNTNEHFNNNNHFKIVNADDETNSYMYYDKDHYSFTTDSDVASFFKLENNELKDADENYVCIYLKELKLVKKYIPNKENYQIYYDHNKLYFIMNQEKKYIVINNNKIENYIIDKTQATDFNKMIL